MVLRTRLNEMGATAAMLQEKHKLAQVLKGKFGAFPSWSPIISDVNFGKSLTGSYECFLKYENSSITKAKLQSTTKQILTTSPWVEDSIFVSHPKLQQSVLSMWVGSNVAVNFWVYKGSCFRGSDDWNTIRTVFHFSKKVILKCLGFQNYLSALLNI